VAARPAKTPLFVINGDRDPYVPLEDIVAFEGRPMTEIRVVRGAGHCAAEALGAYFLEMSRWLRGQLRPTEGNDGSALMREVETRNAM
jgi:pimeloyl-ACP methyl ester carboxylesterase